MFLKLIFHCFLVISRVTKDYVIQWYKTLKIIGIFVGLIEYWNNKILNSLFSKGISRTNSVLFNNALGN